MKLFCKHEWKVIQSEITPSLIERLTKLGMSSFKNAEEDKTWATRETIVACNKCGGIKRYVQKV